MQAATFAPSFRPVVSRKNVTTVRGDGYLYHFHKKASDLLAKLKISRALLEEFQRRCGTVNTTKLPGLYVMEQGGGWYEVFVLDPLKTGSVLQFLQRLNRWVLKMAQPKSERPKGSRYFVVVRGFEHKNAPTKFLTDEEYKELQRKRAEDDRVRPVEPTKLQDMVARFNAKFKR